ncbi:spore germination protein [Paenibacillus taihuensis]|nr:spore germination protein [Paenibacillus taihuensis]
MDIGSNIIENEKTFKTVFQDCSDVVFRDITIHGETRILLIYVDGMINSDIITANLLKPLIYDGLLQGLGTIDSVAQMCAQQLFPVLSTKKLSNFEQIAEFILKGNVAILADGEETVLLADVSNFKTRSPEEPFNEASIRGSKEGFTESLRINTAMLRRIAATPKLKLESMTIGELTKTDIVITYIEGIVSMPVLVEVREKLKGIHIDKILESGYIEESIEDTHLSPFPQMMVTERPDVVGAGLLEGKVAILTDGDPCVLIVPTTFWEGLLAHDDYYERFLFVSMIRWVRFIFAFFSVLFPSIYIVLTNYHIEMVPLELMMTIASLRERSPFPTVIEVFMMEFVFEGLREAGIRLPKQIGPLVSIVGALIIGEAAVQAGIVSAPIVIVVAAAGISSFIIPRFRFGYALRILRFPLLILSGTFGLFGLGIGMMAILIHLIHLSPFGTPYLTPVAPQIARKFTHLILRRPRKRVIETS